MKLNKPKTISSCARRKILWISIQDYDLQRFTKLQIEQKKQWKSSRLVFFLGNATDIVIRDREHYKATAVPDEVDTGGALIPNIPRNTVTNAAPPPPRQGKILRNERAEMEAEQRRHCISQWARLEKIKEGMENGVEDDIRTWMTIAKGLIDDFRREKLFFPGEKGKRITWYDDGPPPTKPVKEVKKETKRKKSSKLAATIESRVEELQQRLLETLGTISELLCPLG
jgi:hypothetical protein